MKSILIMKAMQLFSKVNPINTEVKANGSTDMPRPNVSAETDGTTKKVAPINPSTLLSKNFPLVEFTNSNTASRLGIDNTPDAAAIVNLRSMAKSLLQPIRSKVAQPVVITSGYRSLELNRSLGSKDTSQHIKGQAADIYVPGYTAYQLASRIVREGFSFDQLILENYDGPGTGWVHISYVSAAENRGEVLTISGSDVHLGLVEHV